MKMMTLFEYKREELANGVSQTWVRIRPAFLLILLFLAGCFVAAIVL